MYLGLSAAVLLANLDLADLVAIGGALGNGGLGGGHSGYFEPGVGQFQFKANGYVNKRF
jgi:hypothetical protein